MTSNRGPGRIWADLSRGNQQLQFNRKQDEFCDIPGRASLLMVAAPALLDDQPAVTHGAGTVLNNTEYRAIRAPCPVRHISIRSVAVAPPPDREARQTRTKPSTNVPRFRQTEPDVLRHQSCSEVR